MVTTIRGATDGSANSEEILNVVAEDSVHVSGDTGIILMAVRTDTAAALAGTTGDYTPLISDSSGRLHVGGAVTSITVPPAIYHGKKTVTAAGTDETLASTQAILSGVTIKAEASNTGIMYVGTENVSSSDGFELAAGEQLFLEVANLTTVWLDCSVSGDGVTYIAT